MEIWAGIGFNSVYEVSTHGRIRRVAFNKTYKDGRIFPYKAQMMKGYELYGYSKIGLIVDSKPKHYFVHRLVAEAFIPNPLNLPFINHKNFIKNDNRLENLEWVDRIMNMEHAKVKIYKGCSKLSDEDARNIYIRFHKNNDLLSDIAKDYSVNIKTISSIVYRKTRRGLPKILFIFR